jgi:hypothetical protein
MVIVMASILLRGFLSGTGQSSAFPPFARFRWLSGDSAVSGGTFRRLLDQAYFLRQLGLVVVVGHAASSWNLWQNPQYRFATSWGW